MNGDVAIKFIGWFAIFLTTVQFIPQVVRAYRLKKLTGLSLSTFSMIILTASTWIGYGILKSDGVVILANAFVLISAIMIVLRILYLRKMKQHLNRS